MLHVLAELEFPSIDNLVKWPAIFGDGQFYSFNKIALQYLIAFTITVVLFAIAGSKKKLVPSGVQNLIESSVAFVDKGIVQQTIGAGGSKYVPYLTTMFFFVFISNLFEVIPPFFMPANARMAGPAFFALTAWLFFICAGVRANGPKYFLGVLFPPGVPKALYILVTPIEFISTFIIRPFALAVRLFANMLAGHILLVTFAVLCIALWSASLVAAALVLSFPMLVALTAFEVMVAFLQAYVITILAAVFIGGAVHPEH